MSIGLQYHGQLLPDWIDGKEVCCVCGEPSRYLQDDDEGLACPYCHEMLMEQKHGGSDGNDHSSRKAVNDSDGDSDGKATKKNHI